MVLSRLSRWCYQHRFSVIACWVVLLVAGVLTAPTLLERLSSDAGDLPGSEASTAEQLVDQASPTLDTVAAALVTDPADRPVLRAEVERLEEELLAISGVASVGHPWSPARLPVTEDGTAALVSVQLTGSDPEEVAEEVAAVLRD